MGKGARNRAKRREEAERGPRPPMIDNGLTEELLEELFGLEDAAALSALLARHPELQRGRAAKELEALAGANEYAVGFRQLRDLIQDFRTSPDAAWTRFDEARARTARLSDELAASTDEIDSAAEAGDFDRVLALIDPALDLAREAGLFLPAVILLLQRGSALLLRPTGDRAENIEASISAFEEGLNLAPPGAMSADLLMQIGLAYSERIRGDRRENLVRSIELLRLALDELEPDAPAETRAMMRTNLAMALMRSEDDDRVAVLQEAADLCEAALQDRSPEENADNWAYSQLNLGEIHEDLAGLGEGDLADARRAYARVIDESHRIDEQTLVGAAHHRLGRLELRAADRVSEDALESDDEEEVDVTPQLETARDHLERARSLTEPGRDRLRHAFVLEDLSDALARLDENDAAIAVARAALAILRPTSAPVNCVRVARRLGNLLAERGTWDGSAAAFRDAVEAAELSFHGRLDTGARRDELRRAGNLSRWAAYAIARSGDPHGAALVLESGRARELRRRLGLQAGEEARFAALPREARDAYRAAAAQLATSSLDDATGDPARALQEVVSAIRDLPGFEDFATGARAEDLTAALEPGWPLVYVNPTPWGTLLLQLRLDADELAIDNVFLDEPVSLDVFMHLMIGDAAGLPDPLEADTMSSYLFGISGQGDPDRDFQLDLDEALPWLGASVARHVRDLVASVGADGVTLVLCGPIGVAPIHAAPWEEDGELRCLIDDLEVRYAPSAALCGASLRRAAVLDAADPTLIALGDPTGDLEAARPEVEEIAQLFGDEHSTTAFGVYANRAFLRRHAGSATHLHLACHATGALLETDDAGIILADGLLPAAHVTAVVGVSTRLAVISACQSGLSEISGTPDEVNSIATAMLAAGSACSIASLWPVDDLATALLMTRLYEELLETRCRPPEALRCAQLWLRDLTSEREAAFLSAHPALEAEFRRRAARDDAPGSRRGRGGGARGPFAHPDYWAPFVAVGA